MKIKIEKNAPSTIQQIKNTPFLSSTYFFHCFVKTNDRTAEEMKQK